MKVLLDTNLVGRVIHTADPQHAIALAATARSRTAGEELVVVPQCLYEFWVIATRPIKDNGFGFSIIQAAAELVRIRQLFSVLDDTPAILPEWERLVTTHSVIGKTAHDARLVAVMNVHGVTHLLTFNIGDFTRYPGLTVLDPAAVAAAGP